jgi:hypothetical protein
MYHRLRTGMNPRLAVLAMTALLLLAVCVAPLFPALYLAFAAVCHQSPDRCFHFYGLPLAVCARCLGIYAGALAAALWPVRLPLPWLWILAAANALEFLSGLGSLPARFFLAAAFCWFGLSRLMALASAPEAAGN